MGYRLFFIMWGRKKEFLNVYSGLMPPGAGVPSLLQVRSLPVGRSRWPRGRVSFSFWCPLLKSWSVTPDKKVFMTKETEVDVMSN